MERMRVEAELLCTDFSKLFDVALLAYSEGRKCYSWINKHTHKVMRKLSSQPVVNIWFSSLVLVDISLCISSICNCFSMIIKKIIHIWNSKFLNEVRLGLQWTYKGLPDTIYKIVFFRGFIVWVCASKLNLFCSSAPNFLRMKVSRKEVKNKNPH